MLPPGAYNAIYGCLRRVLSNFLKHNQFRLSVFKAQKTKEPAKRKKQRERRKKKRQDRQVRQEKEAGEFLNLLYHDQVEVRGKSQVRNPFLEHMEIEPPNENKITTKSENKRTREDSGHRDYGALKKPR